MFPFLKKNKVENIEEKTISPTPTPPLSTEDKPILAQDGAPVPEQKPDEPYPYNPVTRRLLGQKIAYILQLVNPKTGARLVETYPESVLIFDKITKRRWKGMEEMGFKPALITEEEFWSAFINQSIRNSIKMNMSRVMTAKSENDGFAAKIQRITARLDESSRFLSAMRDKMKNLEERRRVKDAEIKKSLILRNEVFAFCGKEYRVTCRAKKLLLELEKIAGWVNTKELSERVHESEKYTGRILLRLMHYGYPITSHTMSGKRFWALIRNESNDRVSNSDVVKTSPDLIIHALYLYNYLYGRPPSTSDVASQLKLDVTYVKNELSKLESRGKVKSEKIEINGKKIKAWKPTTVIEKRIEKQ